MILSNLNNQHQSHIVNEAVFENDRRAISLKKKEKRVKIVRMIEYVYR